MRINKLAAGLLLAVSVSAFANYENALNASFDGVRVYHKDTNKILGYAVEKGNSIGGYFSVNTQEKSLKIGESRYHLNNGRFVKNITDNRDNFVQNVVPYFSKRYGQKYSDGSTGKAYVFLDYSCPFSRAFVEKGGLERLRENGKEVWLMPMSRDATTEGILNYSALTCSSEKNDDKVSRFLGWMKQGKASVEKSELKAANCYYWLDLKPYYGLVNELGFDGVPAVIEVD